MGIEIEAKMRVADFDAVRRRLIELDAHRVGAMLETNTFFDTADRSLLSADKGLRLRRAKDVASGAESFLVTVKGPARPGALKSREESEVRVADGAGTIDVLHALGYQPELSFEKKRESWELGGCKIELDELPILGRFVEIEGPGEETVMQVREQLGLHNLPPIKTGYISMLSRHLKERNDSRKSITF